MVISEAAVDGILRPYMEIVSILIALDGILRPYMKIVDILVLSKTGQATPVKDVCLFVH